MNLMHRLTTRMRVLLFALSVAAVMGGIALIVTWVIFDPVVRDETIGVAIVQALVLGGGTAYYLGLKVMQVNLLSHELDRMASYDFLTKALTRSRFFASIAAEPDLHGAFLVFDMNDFKQINDTLGHAAGDVALIKVAEAARAHLGPDDFLCRLGGDEFLAFFKGLDFEHVRDRARSIAMAISAQSVGNGAGAVQLSACFGISVLEKNGGIDAAIGLADADLYRAKSIFHRNLDNSARLVRSKARLAEAARS